MFWFFIILAGFGILTRFITHPANFTAISALALFGSFYLNKKQAFLIPNSAMFFPDLFLGFYEIKIMAAVYLSFILTVLAGIALKKQKQMTFILISGLFAAILFFIITNGAVFLFSPWYEKSINGLLKCFILALPFFRNHLIGNLFYSGLLFGAFELYIYFKKYNLKVKFNANNRLATNKSFGNTR